MSVLEKLKAAPREAIHGVRSDGFRLGLQTVFAPWLTEFFRQQGGSWHPGGRMWVFPRATVNGQFAQRLASEAPSGVVFTVAKTVELIRQAIASPHPDLFADGLDVQLYPVAGGGTALQYKRDALLDQVMLAIGGKTLQGRSGWFLDLSATDLLNELAARAGIGRDYVYVHDAEMHLTETGGTGADPRPRLWLGVSKSEERTPRIEAERMASILSVAMTPLQRFEVDPRLVEQARRTYSLYDYQVPALQFLLGLSGGLEADDMGLGKTVTTIAVCGCVEGSDPVLVICPAPLLVNWQREINRVRPDQRVGIVGIDKEWRSADWIVVNFERLGTIVEAMNEKLVSFRAVAIDEAHNLKDPTSGRTRNAFLICAQVPRVYPMTATPLLNDTAELHVLLRLTGHPLGQIPVGEFVKEHAGSPELRQALRDRLSEWMIRRPKSVIKGLKGKSHQLQYVQLSPDSRRAYDLVVADEELEALVKVGKLRQLLERAKTDWIIETIRAMAPDDKVIVSCEHLEVIPIIAEALNATGFPTVTYMGKGMTPKARQAALDRFQDEPDVRVIVCMRKGAGVGLTLTAANYVIMVSLPWNAALRRQMEDRAYRNGQTRHVTVLIPIVPGTIDERVLALNRYKESLESDILEDSEDRAPNPLDILEPIPQGAVA